MDTLEEISISFLEEMLNEEHCESSHLHPSNRVCEHTVSGYVVYHCHNEVMKACIQQIRYVYHCQDVPDTTCANCLDAGKPGVPILGNWEVVMK